MMKENCEYPDCKQMTMQKNPLLDKRFLKVLLISFIGALLSTFWLSSNITEMTDKNFINHCIFNVSISMFFALALAGNWIYPKD